MYSFMKREDYNPPAGVEKDFSNYYYFKDVLSDEQIELIKRIAKRYPMSSGTAGGAVRKGYRKSKICWLPKNKETMWLYEKLGDLVKKANKLWEFDITGFGEDLQFGEYNSEDKGYYDWHLDIGTDSLWRKISMSIQLSDPDSYEGGDLQFHKSQDINTAPRDKGAIIFFPSFLCHRVTPVTKGVRHSLVTWITGPSYR